MRLDKSREHKLSLLYRLVLESENVDSFRIFPGESVTGVYLYKTIDGPGGIDTGESLVANLSLNDALVYLTGDKR